MLRRHFYYLNFEGFHSIMFIPPQIAANVANLLIFGILFRHSSNSVVKQDVLPSFSWRSVQNHPIAPPFFGVLCLKVTIERRKGHMCSRNQ